MTRLLERERELETLDELIAAARNGDGGLVVIEAAAGLGKTRLVQAVRERCDAAGLRTLAARATELEQDFPFGIARQLLAPPLASLDPPEREALLDGAAGAARGALGLAGGADGESAADAFAVLYGLYWLILELAERRPLLPAVDDVHWSDAASLDFLGFLVPRLEELPVLLVLACRPDEAAARSGLARIATDASARRLAPRELSEQAVGELLAEQLGDVPDAAFAASCHEVSGGNPFLLSELARTLAGERIPPAAGQARRVRELASEGVARTVLVRLGRLSDAARALARAVVALGEDGDVRLAAALIELDEDVVVRAADELRSAAILDAGAALRFSHPLVRTSLAAELPAGEHAELHARTAELLRARGAGAQQLAAHLVATAPRGERATVETLVAAARTALASGAPRSASAYLTRALREPAPEDLRATVLDRIVTAGIRAPDGALFAEVLPELLDELERQPALLLRTCGKVSIWMILNGRADDATRLLQRAIALAKEQGDAEAAFRFEAQLNLLAQRSLRSARARLEPYVDQLPPDGASGRLAAALASEWHAYDGTAADAVEAARHALARGGRIFVEQPEFFAPGRPVLALIHADELEQAQRAADQALAFARRRNAAPELLAALWMNGGVAWARGDLAVAEADGRQAIEVVRLSGLRFAEPPLQALLAGILVARGELDAAEAALAAHAPEALPDAFVLVLVLFARGQLRFEQGRYEQAAADFLELQRRAKAWGVIGAPAPPAGILAARAVAALGERERARGMAQEELAHARRWGAPTLLARALCTLAMAVDGAERLAALEQAVAVLEGSPARLVRAESLADLGAALRRAGRRADARAPLREALELARRCGAAGLARRAHDELAATGEKVRRYTPIGVESLTPSERRVAEMAASGLTNRQIAQTLFVTIKTIETHLAAAYDKLGIRSRRELPAALHEAGDVRGVTV